MDKVDEELIDYELYEFMTAVAPEDRNAVLDALVAEFYQCAAWSNITPQVNDVRQANGGTGIAFYYKDPKTAEIYIPMVVPVSLRDGTKNPKGKDEKYQIPGGHINFAEKETLVEACLRENAEEVAGRHGPILTDIDPSQLVALDNLLIYPNGLPMFVHGFGLALNQDQFEKLKKYSDKKTNITKYTKDNEIRNIKVVTLSEVIGNPDALNHPDQLSLFKKLREYLSVKPVSGFTPPNPA